jgi:hypothetical protein
LTPLFLTIKVTIEKIFHYRLKIHMTLYEASLRLKIHSPSLGSPPQWLWPGIADCEDRKQGSRTTRLKKDSLQTAALHGTFDRPAVDARSIKLVFIL